MKRCEAFVALTGACGTGKTTLAYGLKRYYEGEGYQVYVIPEIARVVLEEYQNQFGNISLQDLRDSWMYGRFQVDILRRQIEAEDEAKDFEGIVISDRSIFDNLLYLLLWCRLPEDGEAYTEYLKTLEERLNSGVPYDLLVHVPPFGRVDRDGVRDWDAPHQELQDSLLSFLYNTVPRSVYLCTVVEQEPHRRVLEINYFLKNLVLGVR